MNLLRLIFWVIAGLLGWTLLRRWLRSRDPLPDDRTTSPPLQMVRCAHCGLHLPQQDALKKNNHWYCTRLHLEADHLNHRTK